MRVTCHRVRAVTRRHSRGMAATQAKRFTSSVAGIGFSFSVRHFTCLQRWLSSTLYHYPLGNTCRARVLCNFHYKWKRSEMDLVTRIYCEVAAFEREHALSCKKKECEVPVQTRERKAMCSLYCIYVPHILRWSTYWATSLYNVSIKGFKFSLRHYILIEIEKWLPSTLKKEFSNKYQM